MDKKRNVWIWIALILIIAAVGTIGFLIGKITSDSKYKAEKELDYRIEPGISRKKMLVPAITDVLESYPKE